MKWCKIFLVCKLNKQGSMPGSQIEFIQVTEQTKAGFKEHWRHQKLKIVYSRSPPSVGCFQKSVNSSPSHVQKQFQKGCPLRSGGLHSYPYSRSQMGILQKNAINGMPLSAGSVESLQPVTHQPLRGSHGLPACFEGIHLGILKHLLEPDCKVHLYLPLPQLPKGGQ